MRFPPEINKVPYSDSDCVENMIEIYIINCGGSLSEGNGDFITLFMLTLLM